MDGDGIGNDNLPQYVGCAGRAFLGTRPCQGDRGSSHIDLRLYRASLPLLHGNDREGQDCPLAIVNGNVRHVE